MPDPNEAIRSLYANPRMAAARAARLAMDPQGFDALLDRQHQLTIERAQRSARATAAAGTHARPSKRIFNLPPLRSRQYVPATSSRVVRDMRICHGAARLALYLRARAGRDGFCRVTIAFLASVFNVHRSTIKRWLHQLRDADAYILTEVERNGRGMDIGLIVTVGRLLEPFYKFVQKSGAPGGSLLRPIKARNLKEESNKASRLWKCGQNGYEQLADAIKKGNREVVDDDKPLPDPSDA